MLSKHELKVVDCGVKRNTIKTSLKGTQKHHAHTLYAYYMLVASFDCEALIVPARVGQVHGVQCLARAVHAWLV